MVVCVTGIFCFGIFFIVSGNVRLPKTAGAAFWKRPFYRAAVFVMDRLQRSDRAGKGRAPDAGKKRAFDTGRLANALAVAFIGLVATAVVQVCFLAQSKKIEGGRLDRPEKGRGNQISELQVSAGEEIQTEPMEIVLKEREYTLQEKQEFLDQAMERLPELILGENSTPDEVRQKINLPSRLLDDRVTVQWIWEPFDLVDENGNLKEDLSKDGELLQLHADLNCDGEEAFYECALRLFPPNYTQKEQLLREVQKSIEKADENSARDSAMPLPKEAGGEMLSWSRRTRDITGAGLLLTVVAVIGLWAGQGRELQNQKQARSRQLLLDYPTLLFQLSMLLNAGMTMQNAFSKMALDYRNRKKGRVRHAYEEMLVSYYEMQSGVPETKAYENFGKRCGESVYIKLGSQLSGNLQKGSQGLAKMLQEEAGFSMEERRQLAKRLGEEAGTKLLLPMMLMLLVVLVILMIPAVMAF